MSAPTGDPRVVAALNDLLGQELGRNAAGKPYFTWRWSEDLFWPAFATGKSIVAETKVKIPVIGAPAETHDYESLGAVYQNNNEDDCDDCRHCGEPETHLSHNVYSIQQTSEPEYKRDRQYRRRDTWVICKWLTPWELILGPGRGFTSLKHGEQASSEKEPDQAEVLAQWNRLYPGAPFPAKGWRIPTDAYLPNGPQDENWAMSPFGHTSPHLQDTEHFIRNVKFQTSRPFDEVLQSMLDDQDRESLQKELQIGEICRDAFPAFLNDPGKKGFVSFPTAAKDRLN